MLISVEVISFSLSLIIFELLLTLFFMHSKTTYCKARLSLCSAFPIDALLTMIALTSLTDRWRQRTDDHDQVIQLERETQVVRSVTSQVVTCDVWVTQLVRVT